MRELIDIILRISKQGTGGKDVAEALKDVEKGTKKAEGAFDGLQKSWTKVAAAGAGVAAAFYTLKKAYDFTKEGANIAQTAQSFDRLMNSMGVAPDILDRLREASRGTVDDMTIMSSTMTLLAGTSEELGRAMVDAAPQLMEIAKAAHKLNPAAGDVEYFYNSVASGIKRSSPLILDNLGLVVKVGDANEAMAKQLGKSVEALTSEEKQMALLNAVLESGDRMIQQVGGSTEEMGDSFAQLETKVKNATDTVKEGFARMVLGILDASTSLSEYEELLERNEKAALNGAESYKEYARALLLVSLETGKLTKGEYEAMQAIIEGTREMGWGTEQIAGKIGLLTEAEYGLTRETDRVSEAWQRYAAAINAEAHPATEKLGSAIDTTVEASGYLVWQTERFAEAAADRAARAADDFRGSLDLLHMAISGEVGEAYEQYQSDLADLDQAFANSEISAAEYKSSIDEVTAAFHENNRALAFNIAEKQILDALEKGLIEDVNNSGTAYDEANTILWTTAERLGLVDEATVAFMEGIQDATTSLLDGNITLEAYGDQLDINAGKAGTFRGNLKDAADEIRNMPQFKKFVLEYKTKYTTTGQPPPVTGPGGAPITTTGGDMAMQHGGQFVVRGPAGTDRVPVSFRATRGEVVTVTPIGGMPPPNPVTNNYNLNVTTGQQSAGVIQDFTIMQQLVA